MDFLEKDAQVIGNSISHPTGRRRFLSFSDVETLVLLNRAHIEANGYDCVCAIARGGLYAGAMISQFTGIPLFTSTFNRSTRIVQSELGAPAAPGRRLLVVEDIAGMGHTLSTTVDHFEKSGWEVDTFCLVFDDLSRLRPTFGMRLESGERSIFPWERGIASVDFKKDRKTSDPDVWVIAFDLDGVFLDDVPTEIYNQDLNRALAMRDALPAYSKRPPQWKNDGNALIFSARLQSERLETQAWLMRNDFRTSAVILRKSLDIDPAEHKACAIIEHGVTEFIESEKWQAQAIAALVPHCVVWHYDAKTNALKRCA